MDAVNFESFHVRVHEAQLEEGKSINEWRSILNAYPDVSISREVVDSLDLTYRHEMLRLLKTVKKEMEIYYTNSPWIFLEWARKWEDDPDVAFEVDNSFKVVGVGVFFNENKLAIYVPNSIDKMMNAALH